jgi:hypothetical protein
MRLVAFAGLHRVKCRCAEEREEEEEEDFMHLAKR